MFFDQENQRHYNFGELLNNLKMAAPQLKRFTKEPFDRDLIEEIRELKDAGNRGAHSLRVEFDEGEMEERSSQATSLCERLYEVWEGVQASNQA